jgi:hypothetical protein
MGAEVFSSFLQRLKILVAFQASSDWHNVWEQTCSLVLWIWYQSQENILCVRNWEPSHL